MRLAFRPSKLLGSVQVDSLDDSGRFCKAQITEVCNGGVEIKVRYIGFPGQDEVRIELD